MGRERVWGRTAACACYGAVVLLGAGRSWGTVLVEYLARVGPAPVYVEAPALKLNPDDLWPPLALSNPVVKTRGYVTLRNGQIWPELPPQADDKQAPPMPNSSSPIAGAEPKKTTENVPPAVSPPAEPAPAGVPDAILRFFVPGPGGTNIVEGVVPSGTQPGGSSQPGSRATYSNPPSVPPRN